MNTPQKNPAAVALGRLGGKAGTGSVKARSSAKARKAARARWAKVRAAAPTTTTEPKSP